jgi:cell division protein FtsQ
MEDYRRDYRLEGVEFKDIDRLPKKRKKKHYFLRFLIFCALVGLGFIFLRSSYFAVSEYQVEGNVYYTKQEILAMAKAEKGENLFFSKEIKNIESRLEKDPYFISVKVKRKLPRTINIKVEERRQTAAFPFGDKYIVIDDKGFILRKTAIDPELTLLTGLTITNIEMGEKVEVEEESTLETTLNMLKTMKDGDLYFKRIDMSKVVIRCYIYDSFLVKGSPREISGAIDSGDLQKVISNLFKQGITRGTLTMNGDDYISFSPLIDG